MKVAVSYTSENLNATVEPRFGRCPYYVIIDTETMVFETIPNTSMSSPSDAGIGAAQLVAEKSAEVVLTGAVGPNAMAALSQANIKIVTRAQGGIKQAVEAFKSCSLKTESSSGYRHRSLYGRGSGRGMGIRLGIGRGMGRGMGIGRGIGVYQNQTKPQTPIQKSPTPMTKEQEKEALHRQLNSWKDN